MKMTWARVAGCAVLAASATMLLMAAAPATPVAKPASEFGLSEDMKGRFSKAPKDVLAKIDAALPSEPVAKPAKARKLLVYVGVGKGNYYHDSIPVAAASLTRLGEKTGAYTATVTDDQKVFTAENLAKFDGIFMVSTTGDHPNADGGTAAQAEGRKAFSDYIKSGHGLMGTHAGGDSNHPWAEYQDMIGGEFAGHPYGKVAVKNEDPSSPINAAFGGKGFVISDEIYTFKPLTDKRSEGYSRDKVHVLLSIDLEKSKLKDTTRKDGDYALAWTKEYGQGRVFYCSLGHNMQDFINPILMKHYLAGIQYSLGDIKADATPSSKLPKDWKVGAAPDIDDKAASINVK